MEDRGTRVLFEPVRVRNLSLKSRIVMAPMTRGFAADGIIGAEHVDYYRRRAEADVGLVITEGVGIARPSARNEPGVPEFHGKALPGWRRVAEAVNAVGGAIAPQLWHVGAVRARNGWQADVPMESPSGLFSAERAEGRAMGDADIADTIAAFASSARSAMELGFAAVELHAAHGYLFDQFFWPDTNRRDDAYGGADLRARSRFAVEVVQAIRAEVGPEFPLIMRISQWKVQNYQARIAENPAQLEQWLLPLVEAGVDVLHCSQRRFWLPEFPDVDGEQGLNLAGWAKKLTGATTISVGSVGLADELFEVFREGRSAFTDLDELVRRMERDEFDLIAVGRSLISDPEWATKVKAGRLGEVRGYDAADLASLL